MTSGEKLVCDPNVVALRVIVWLSLLIVAWLATPRVSEAVSVANGSATGHGIAAPTHSSIVRLSSFESPYCDDV